jgi:hypothetical protein
MTSIDQTDAAERDDAEPEPDEAVRDPCPPARPAGARLLRRGGSSVEAAMALAARRKDRGHDKRALLRGVALFLSLAVPLGFVALVNHVRSTTGVNWLDAVGGLVALSRVVATAVISSRR